MLYIVEHVRELRKIIRFPGDLKAKVKRLARLNNMTYSDLIRLCIETKLPDHESGYSTVERRRK